MVNRLPDGIVYIQRSNQDYWMRENGAWVRKGNIRDEGNDGIVGVSPVLNLGFLQSVSITRTRFLESFAADNGFELDVILSRIRAIALSEQFGFSMEAALTISVVIPVESIIAEMAVGFDMTAVITRTMYATVSALAGFDMSVSLFHGLVNYPELLAIGDSLTPYVRFLDTTLTKISNPATIPSGTIFSSSYSANERWIAVAQATMVHIYDCGSGAPVYSTTLTSPGTAWTTLVRVAFSPDSTKLLVCDNAISPYCWMFNVGAWTTAQAPVPGQQVQNADWKPDGTEIVLGLRAAPYVKVFNASTGAAATLNTPANVPTNVVRGIRYFPDGLHIAAVSAANELMVYRTDTLVRTANLTVAGLASTPILPDILAVSPDGSKMAVGNGASPWLTVYSQVAHVTTLLTGPSTLPSTLTRALVFSKDGGTLFAGHNAASTPWLYSYTVGSWAKNTDPPGQPGAAPFTLSTNLASMPKMMVVGDAVSPYSTFYNNAGVKLANPASIPASIVQAADMSKDGRFFAITASTRVLIYEIIAGVPTKIQDFARPGGGAWSQLVGVRWNNAGTRLLVIDNATSPYIHQFNTTTWTTVTAPTPGLAVQNADYSPDDSRILIGFNAAASPNCIRIYDAVTGAHIVTPATNTASAVRSVKYFPDGLHYAVLSSAPALLVYRSDTNAQTYSLTTGSVQSLPDTLAISPDGSKIAIVTTVSPYIYLWTQSGHTTTPSTSAQAGYGSGRGLRFSADGTKIYAAFQAASTPWVAVYDVSTMLRAAMTGQPAGNPFTIVGNI